MCKAHSLQAHGKYLGNISLHTCAGTCHIRKASWVLEPLQTLDFFFSFFFFFYFLRWMGPGKVAWAVFFWPSGRRLPSRECCFCRWRSSSGPGCQVYRCCRCGRSYLVPDPAEPGCRLCHPLHKAPPPTEQLYCFRQQPLQLQAGLGHLLLWGWPG